MFVPLHVKSYYSLGYGTASIDELVDEASMLGFSALALTDLENLSGQVQFHYRCCAKGIKPITGLELRAGFDGRNGFGRKSERLILLAADQQGYRSLCRIVSARRTAKGRPSQEHLTGSGPLPLVVQNSGGLFALSDNAGLIRELLVSGAFSRDRLGILLVRPGMNGVEPLAIESARRLAVPLVADLDVVFLKKPDHRLHMLQLAIRQRRKINDVANSDVCESRERWLRSPADARLLFADLPGAVAAAQSIADACRLDLSAAGVRFPVTGLPSGTRPDDRLRERCRAAVAERRTRNEPWSPSHDQRLAQELAVFEDLGFSAFMLLIDEILVHCRKEGIPVIARGSAVSSLIIHLLGASPIDPLSQGLLFERFVHGGKSEWPDVDLDLPWHRRDEVIDWIYEHFGIDRVATVSAHHKFQRRSALREGLKAWGVSSSVIDSLSRALPPEDLGIEEVDFLGLGEADNEHQVVVSNEFETSSRGVPADVLALVQRLIGRPRHLAAHPGGMVFSQEPIGDILPLERASKGVVITQYDLTTVAALGLVKIDLLGNRCLSEIQETLRLAGNAEPGLLERIPENDRATLALIDQAKTIGCFQLESPAMRTLLASIPIRHQSDITAALALIRPGAAGGNAKREFIRRSRGEYPESPVDPSVADRLRETHGLFLYEEDIMVLLAGVAGLDLAEADEVRTAIIKSGGDTDALRPIRERFLRQAAARPGTGNLPRARRAWEDALRFAAYSFNKAHAASFGQLAYLSAYMKAHHPLEFSCALINHHQSIYPLRTIMGEIVRLGVEVKGPHVNLSTWHSHIEEYANRAGAGTVRVGLDKVKVLSQRSAAALLAERSRSGRFSSFRNFVERTNLSTRELTALILSGSCDSLEPLTVNAYPFLHEAVVKHLQLGSGPEVIEGLRIQQSPVKPEDQSHLKLYQALTRLRNELRYLQMHLVAHPMALLRVEANRYDCLPISVASSATDSSYIRLAATVAAMRRITTKQGVMQFVTLEDESGLIEAAVLPPTYRRLGNRITTPGPFLVLGRLRQNEGAVYLEVDDMEPFYRRPRPFHGKNRRLCGKG